jgi:hypothetical protein
LALAFGELLIGRFHMSGLLCAEQFPLALMEIRERDP